MKARNLAMLLLQHPEREVCIGSIHEPMAIATVQSRAIKQGPDEDCTYTEVIVITPQERALLSAA